MKWIRASERTPKDDKMYHLKIDGETVRIGNFYQGEATGETWVNVAGYNWQIAPSRLYGVEWLDQSHPIPAGEQDHSLAIGRIVEKALLDHKVLDSTKDHETIYSIGSVVATQVAEYFQKVKSV